MRSDRLCRLLPLAALLAIVTASPVVADHCGAEGTVTPASGPVGTTFVFSTNLGEPSVLQLYRDGHLSRTVSLPGDGFVSYDFKSSSGDAGHWRAYAALVSSPRCSSTAFFTVLGTPDTSIRPVTPQSTPSAPILAMAGLLGFVLMLRRSRRTPSSR
jgi:hypothetical protein